MSPEKPVRLLVDTNVWLDHYIVGRPGSEAATAFLSSAYERGAVLLYPAACIRDVFFLICVEFKRARRRDGGILAEEDVQAIRHIAWGCVDNMRELATAVGMDEADLWLACKYRTLTWDLEDNVVLAAAQRAEADYLVTSDRALIQRSTVAALTPGDMTALLDA